MLANDSDPLGEGLTLVNAKTNQGEATVEGDVVRYAPDDFIGAAIVTYTMRDAANREASGTIEIETLGPPEKPAPPDVKADSGKATITWTTPKRMATHRLHITSSSGATRGVELQNSLTWIRAQKW